MIFKFRAKKMGGHFHTSVFSALSEDYTFAKLGDIVLDERDYAALKNNAFSVVVEEDK